MLHLSKTRISLSNGILYLVSSLCIFEVIPTLTLFLGAAFFLVSNTSESSSPDVVLEGFLTAGFLGLGAAEQENNNYLLLEQYSNGFCPGAPPFQQSDPYKFYKFKNYN